MPITIRQMLRDRVLTDKERKNLAILEVIRKNGPISRTDISKITEFNIVTVSNYVNHYIKKGLVIEGELDESTGGRKPVISSASALTCSAWWALWWILKPMWCMNPKKKDRRSTTKKSLLSWPIW